MWMNIYIYIHLGKLQITLLKFGGDQILHLEVSEFGFYLLYFQECLDFTS